MAEDSYGMGIPLPADNTKVHQFPGVTRLAMERVAEILAGDLPGGVVDAINAQVGPAVDAELDAAGVVHGAEDLTSDEVAFAIVDASQRRSFLEAAKHAGPTTHSATLIARALTPEVITASGSTMPVPAAISEGPGLGYVVVDSAGRMSEIQLDLAGKLTGPFPARIIKAASDAAVAAANPAAGFPAALWGDSMTAAGSGYGDKLAAELGQPVSIQAIGGQGTPSIAARQAGQPATVTFPNNTIPAGTAATTVTTSVVVYSNPSGTGTSSGLVSIAGVPGTLARDNTTGTVTFTRTTAGTAVWCPPTTPVIPDAATTYRGNIIVIWSGRNSFKTMAKEDIVAHIKAMVDYNSAGRKRFLVLEIAPTTAEPTGNADRINLEALNTLLAKTFPHNYVPVAQYLRGPALADMGITPTAQDTADIAAGVTPESLRSDTLHLNANGNTAVARLVSNTIKAKGWA